MNVVYILCLLFCVSILGGCDTFYGIDRYSHLGIVRLPIRCIVHATREINGISNVNHHTEKGGRELNLSGLHKADIVDSFSYTYRGLYGGFTFLTSYKGIVEFSNTYIYINRRPPQSEIDEIRPVMIKIENAISNKCHIDIHEKVTEKCMGVTCSNIY